MMCIQYEQNARWSVELGSATYNTALGTSSPLDSRPSESLIALKVHAPVILHCIQVRLCTRVHQLWLVKREVDFHV